MTLRSTRIASACLATLLAAGCASTPAFVRRDPLLKPAAARVASAEKSASRDSLTWDKTKKKLEHRPWLAASREDSARLDALRDSVADSAKFDAEARKLVGSMAARAAHEHELAAEGMRPVPDAAALRADLDALVAAELTNLDALKSDSDRRKWLSRMRGEVPPRVVNGGAGWRMAAGFPLVPFLYGWIGNHIAGEDRGPYPHEFEKGTIYSAPTDSDEVVAAHLGQASETALLDFYAPTIVQQVADDARYDPSIDRIGRAEVFLDAKGHVASRVNPESPTVYTYVTHAELAGEWHRQVNYQLWYPEHPPMVSGDPEAGHTEGVLFRLTLDLENRPLLAETVFACGCFHRFFPVDALEREATETHGRIVSGRSALAKEKSFAIDAIIPQTCGAFDAAHPHPFVYVYGGKHFAGAVEFGGSLPAASESHQYILKDAEEMEHLPLSDGRTASFFRRDGLVRGADRSEATMLWATGMYHPGTPRIRGEHLIHFDQYDFDDPHLIETLLRLPSAAFLRRIETSPYAHRTGAGEAGAAPSSDTVPRAKKKAFFCPC